jgi:hypothetical protein
MSATGPRLLDAPALAKRLRELARDKRNVDVDFLLHLDAFDARNAYLDAGYASLWDFCLRELHLREGAAGRRIGAMRVLRRFPALEAPLRDGRLSLCTITMLGPALTAANLEDVVARAAYRTKSEVDDLVASLQPRVAPKEGIRRLPEPRTATTDPVRGANRPPAVTAPCGADPLNPPSDADPLLASPAATEARPDEPATPAPGSGAFALTAPAEPRRTAAEVRAVSGSEWSLRVTIGAECKADLETLVALLSHRNGSDLAGALHEAIRCGIEKHGKRKGAVAPARSVRRDSASEGLAPVGRLHPARGAAADASDGAADGTAGGPTPAPQSRTVPAAVRREVWKRDGGCCAWVGPDGRRCGSRWKLEIDHVDPYGRGGPSDDPDKLRLLCARHNARYAEQVYGSAHMSRFRGAGEGAARPPTKGVVRGLFVREPELAWGEAGAA